METEPFDQFISEECEQGLGYSVPFGELYRAYREWCGRRYPGWSETEKRVAMRLTRLGIDQETVSRQIPLEEGGDGRKTRLERTRRGIRLKPRL